MTKELEVRVDAKVEAQTHAIAGELREKVSQHSSKEE
jgi:hypothetical protein